MPSSMSMVFTSTRTVQQPARHIYSAQPVHAAPVQAAGSAFMGLDHLARAKPCGACGKGKK